MQQHDMAKNDCLLKKLFFLLSKIIITFYPVISFLKLKMQCSHTEQVSGSASHLSFLYSHLSPLTYLVPPLTSHHLSFATRHAPSPLATSYSQHNFHSPTPSRISTTHSPLCFPHFPSPLPPLNSPLPSLHSPPTTPLSPLTYEPATTESLCQLLTHTQLVFHQLGWALQNSPRLSLILFRKATK